MTFDSWLLALHLLFAAALVGALTIFWIAALALRSADQPEQILALGPLMRVGNGAVIVGTLGSVVFGVWLAISLDAYHVWDGWVIAAIVLWAIGSETGRRAGPEYGRAFTRASELAAAGEKGPSAELTALCRSRTGMVLHVISSVAVLLILLDMIWKPGA